MARHGSEGWPCRIPVDGAQDPGDRYTSSESREVRCGSGTDLRRHHQEGLLLAVKQTKSGAKRTLPLEGRLSGVER